jgi:hypothetical protein
MPVTGVVPTKLLGEREGTSRVFGEPARGCKASSEWHAYSALATAIVIVISFRLLDCMVWLLGE